MPWKKLPPRTRNGPRGTVYLIHFATPYGHARHYLGWADDLAARIAQHADGHGSRLMSVVNAAGIAWDVARTWTGVDRYVERQLKNRGGAARLCPICNERGMQ